MLNITKDIVAGPFEYAERVVASKFWLDGFEKLLLLWMSFSLVYT